MNNFDDIFEQPAQQKSPPEQESKAEKPHREWWQIREEKQRKEAYATLDGIFRDFSEGKGDMQAYLDTHSRFDRYSARNALLIMSKAPEATRIGDYKYWISQNVEILKTEKRNPIVILEPGKPYKRQDGSIGQNYYAKEVFDISQTTAREQAQQLVIAYDQRILLKALINNPPVPIRPADELPAEGRGAMFSPDQNAILVRKGMDAPDIFRCVSLELAHAQFARNKESYSREADGYKAYCVSYMLCKKYRIETKGYDVSRLNEVFKGKEPQEIISALSDMENAMGAINSRMAKSIGLNRTSKSKEQER